MQLFSIPNINGITINTNEFRREALFFQKNGYYCAAPNGTEDYRQYWTEQLRRCLEGYTVGGVHISGDHYNYLNFNRILLTDDSSESVVALGNKKRSRKKILSFPDFWLWDREFFLVKDIAENGVTEKDYKKLNLNISIKKEDLLGGKHLCIGKARRKGYSYKTASISANRYNTIRNSTTLIGAFDKKYALSTFSMAVNYLDFLNEHTAFVKKRQYYNTKDQVEASYKIIKHGVEIKKGFKSNIMAITFKDNPDIARGKDASLIIFEEAGTFTNLKESYLATQATVEDGEYVTGIIIVFGTGSTDSAGWEDFSHMFYNPQDYNMISIENVFDKDTNDNYCGFFHPVYMNKKGYIDKKGNPEMNLAVNSEIKERERLQKSGNNAAYTARTIEYPFCPSESFKVVTNSKLPVRELQEVLAKLMRTGHNNNSFTGNLVMDESAIKGVSWEEDLEGKYTALGFNLDKHDNREGAIVIYEHPPEIIPEGMYIIGVDTVSFETSSNSDSLFSVYVYKTLTRWDNTYNTIVAHYVGRYNSLDKMHDILLKMALYFNARIAIENDRGADTLLNFFKGNNPYKKNYFYLLIEQPQSVLDTHIQNSKIDRVIGVPMNSSMKTLSEKLLIQWLTEKRGVTEDGRDLLNLHMIKDPGIIEEMIRYERGKNYDRLSAFFIILIIIEEYNLRHEEIMETQYVVDNSYVDYFKKHMPKRFRKMAY